MNPQLVLKFIAFTKVATFFIRETFCSMNFGFNRKGYKAGTNQMGKVVHTTIALGNCCNTTQSKEGGRHPCKAYFDDCGLIHGELHTRQSIFWYHKCNFGRGCFSKFGILCVGIRLKIIKRTHLTNL